jgi:hypothetical protein
VAPAGPRGPAGPVGPASAANASTLPASITVVATAWLSTFNFLGKDIIDLLFIKLFY